MQLDAVWDRARADLMIAMGRGDPDIFLWEHSSRVAESALAMARLPVVRAQSPDETAILAAALYHESAWAARVRAGEVERFEVLARPTPASHRELSASILETSLSGLISRDALEKASRAVRLLNEREIDFIEGQILTEAENLDEFGVQSLWASIRRGAIEGKGVQAVIDTWHRRKEYQFWTARLNDSFRFARVRELARKRLDALERFMLDLEEQHKGLDISPNAQPKATERVNRSAS
jgi:hypothetical protein